MEQTLSPSLTTLQMPRSHSESSVQREPSGRPPSFIGYDDVEQPATMLPSSTAIHPSLDISASLPSWVSRSPSRKADLRPVRG